jgi:phospholipid/cholesterol/gamma-HCH transport system substrate-binding protein
MQTMRQTHATEISTGLFVLLGFATLFFLVTQISNRDLIGKGATYEVAAQFENIGNLKTGAPVAMSGVTVGRIESINYDQKLYKAVVRMRIDSKYNRIPTDSDASIMTAGLLGGQFVSISPGGADQYLKEGGRIDFVQDAFVLENLINQMVASFGRDSAESSKSEEHAAAASEGSK